MLEVPSGKVTFKLSKCQRARCSERKAFQQGELSVQRQLRTKGGPCGLSKHGKVVEMVSEKAGTLLSKLCRPEY